jgi:hypothetical protein
MSLRFRCRKRSECVEKFEESKKSQTENSLSSILAAFILHQKYQYFIDRVDISTVMIRIKSVY